MGGIGGGDPGGPSWLGHRVCANKDCPYVDGRELKRFALCLGQKASAGARELLAGQRRPSENVSRGSSREQAYWLKRKRSGNLAIAVGAIQMSLETKESLKGSLAKNEKN